MAIWNPWRGCRRHSEGCRFCYIHKGDCRRGVNTNHITKTEHLYAPVVKYKSGKYRIKSGQIVYTCFSTDFLIEEADPWRAECWQQIKGRRDLRFLFLTKRVERFAECIPPDWGVGYDNVIVGCTVENQKRADFRLPIFADLPIRHKMIVCQPMIENMEIERYLSNIELVVVGGESDRNARPLCYDWVLNVREQCIRRNTDFEFRQCGTYFVKDGKRYTLATKDLCSQARKANINYIVDRRGENGA